MEAFEGSRSDLTTRLFDILSISLLELLQDSHIRFIESAEPSPRPRFHQYWHFASPETVVEPNKPILFYLELYLACVEQWDNVDEVESLKSWMERRGYCWKEKQTETLPFKRSRIECVRDHPRPSVRAANAMKWQTRRCYH